MHAPNLSQARFSYARELVTKRGGPTEFLVRHGGRTLVHDRHGVGEEAIFWPFSVSKIWVAALIWSIHSAKDLDVDHPVAAYWPEFAARGKQDITILDVLCHRSGLPRVGGTLAEVHAMSDWHLATTRIANAKPQRSARQKPTYEWLAWGFILAKVAESAGNATFAELLDRRILQPLETTSTYARLPQTETWRAVPLRASSPVTYPIAAVVNAPRVRSACIPAGGIWTNATDLAIVLEEIAAGGARIGLTLEALERMLRPSNAGEFDRYSGSRAWWSHGLQLGHSGRTLMGASAFGRRSTAATFGHNGSNVSMAWHDPDRELTFVHCSGRVDPFPWNRVHLMRVADAVTRAVDETYAPRLN